MDVVVEVGRQTVLGVGGDVGGGVEFGTDRSIRDVTVLVWLSVSHMNKIM